MRGIDFFIPDEWNSGKELVIQPGESVLIPAGVKVEVPFGHALIFHNKSGVAVKKGLHVGADTIDHGYSGEVHINLTNVKNCATPIAPATRLFKVFLSKLNHTFHCLLTKIVYIKTLHMYLSVEPVDLDQAGLSNGSRRSRASL